uniref:Uncharacterized protein n=1 Tax=Corethron hystrix TaxID=216773 RepID=A0A7S1BL88_9STRA
MRIQTTLANATGIILGIFLTKKQNSCHGFTLTFSSHHGPRYSTLSAFSGRRLPALRPTKRFASRDDDEIAALEERLRELKGETAMKDSEDGDVEENRVRAGAGSMQSSMGAASPEESETSMEEDEDDDISVDSFKKARSKVRSVAKSSGAMEAPMEQMLSEGWKTREASSDENTTAGALLGVIAGLIGLVLFSLIPVGQDDLKRYSGNTIGIGQNAATSTKIDLGDLNSVKTVKDTLYIPDEDMQ